MATCYKRLSFSNDEEYKLIEFVKNHPALWDASHGEYGNSELRKIYWVSLAEELKKPVFECRRKWRFVRDYYIHKRPRHFESTPQRDGKYYSLQFLNKVKVSSKKNCTNPDEIFRTEIKAKTNDPKQLSKIEVDFLDSDEIDYDFAEDPTFEKLNAERTPAKTHCEDYSQHQDQDTNDNDAKSEQFFCREDYMDESSTAEEFNKLRHLAEDEQDEGEEEHLYEPNTEIRYETNTEQSNNQIDNSLSLHKKAIDLFFESMAATVKTFPVQYVAEAKCKVLMAINEIECNIFKNENKY